MLLSRPAYTLRQIQVVTFMRYRWRTFNTTDVAMLTVHQQARILAKAGVGGHPLDADDVAAWQHDVEARFVVYTAERAARSLRDAEAARSSDMLRRMNWSVAVA